MAGSKLAEGFEKLINNAGNQVGRLQVGVNKILWGRANTQPSVAVQYTPASGSTPSSLSYNTTVPTVPETAQQKGLKNFSQSGLFNILNALNSVDLCAVITYAYDNINLKRRKRPERQEQTETQRIFYDFQDVCGTVVTYIDKYTAYPTVFIGSYLGLGPNAVPPVIAAEDNGAPIQGGTQVQKYNTYFLMQAIREAFSTSQGSNSIFNQEDIETLRAVPGLIKNVQFLEDVVREIDQFTDYRQIPDTTLQKLVTNINRVRATCVVIQNLDFRDPRGLINIAGNYLGVDIRNQIQQLNKFVDVTKIIPTLKQINDQVRAFIKIANQVQAIVTTGQFIIKVCILFYKVFKFLIVFFKALAIPLIFGTSGTQITLQEAKDRANDESDGVVRILRAINALLGVVVVFVKYLLGNAIELLRRLEILMTTLKGCEAMKDSDVLFELEETVKELTALKDRLEIYIIDYESKTDPNTAQLGEYQIRVIEEQVVESTVTNRRRRGVALDINGRLVVQSDLTFATNTAIIIEEVKQKLLAQGLIRPLASAISPLDLQVFSESFNYLENNDILTEDLNISFEDTETGDNLNENEGLGLQAFVNNIKGGRRLRKRMRERLAANRRKLATQLQNADPSSSITQRAAAQQLAEANKTEVQNLRDDIAGWREEIAAAAKEPASRTINLLIKDRTNKIAAAEKRIRELGG